jgi:flagellar biosynthetic protein FliQ
MDEVQVAIDMGRAAIITTLLVAGPVLLSGLAVGLVISILQAATQIQEQTLTFIPKILAMLAAMFIFLPWMIALMLEFTSRIIENLPALTG